MSDSDSDTTNEKIRRTKRKVVVKFRIEDTSSDDSDVAGPSNCVRTTKRGRKKITTTTDDSSSDSDFALVPKQKQSVNNSKLSSNESETNQRNPSTAADAMLSDNSSDTDSSCESTEKCPICLHSFREQEVGTPNVCEHNFCAPCIEEWSGNVQTCPIDRKSFTHIRIRSRYADTGHIREIRVEAKKSSEAEPSEADFTNCEICGRCDQEETMLLCDGCDAGYHMGCLEPALIEIPEGSWYCDNCFDSDASEDVDITQLIAEMDDLPVPATRLRVRREEVPRITRTRQSERIMATIRNRRQENRSDVVAPLDFSSAGPSHGRQIVTTTTRTTTTTTTTTTTRQSKVGAQKLNKRKKRRRKINRRRRTYVVEYDVDEYNNKFGIKTAKRVIKRRRKVRRSRKKATCSSRRRGQNNTESGTAAHGISSAQDRIRPQYPRLHLFGNKNALEYFSDEDENDEGIGSLNNSFETGDGLLVMARAQSNGLRNIMRKKNIAVSSSAATEPASSDILSNIMDTMNRWHSMTRPTAIEKIKINADGSLESENRSKEKEADARETPNSDIQSAPMYPRNGTPGNGSRIFNNSNGFRGNNSNQSSGNFSQFGSGRRDSDQSSFQRSGTNNSGSGGQGDHLNQNVNLLSFQRLQRGANNNRLSRNRLQLNTTNQLQPQGLYDGEDIAPLENETPIQSEDTLNTEEPSTLKGTQPDNDIANTDLPPNQNSSETEPIRNDDNDDDNETVPSNVGEEETTSEPAETKSNDFSESEDGDEQDFEYSEESMQVAKESKEPDEDDTKEPEQVNASIDNDEDLVQLDDDENFPNETADDIAEEQLNADDTQPEASADVDTNEEAVVEAESAVESPNMSLEPISTLNQNENSTEDISGSEDEEDEEEEEEEEGEEEQRSYTPLNDLPAKNNDDELITEKPSTSSEKNEIVSSGGIEGMDTEMISEDENENILHDDTASKELKADKENNNRKGDGDDSFKKVSKTTKDRNYRDKKEKTDGKHRSRRSRSKSRNSSISRSRSRNRGHRNDKRDRAARRKESKRQELQRYDVRTVIADRQPKTYKDKYGRDASRPPRSRSRSFSPVRRKTRSRSRSVSPAFSPKRRSPARRSVSRTRRRSNSPRRNRRSVSRSRRRRRSTSRSPYRPFNSSRSRSYTRDRLINGQSRSRSKSKSRSFSPRPVNRYENHSRSRSHERKLKKKSGDKKTSKYRTKKKVTGSRKVSPFHSSNRASRSRSWNDRGGSWNRSISDGHNDNALSWTPPIAHAPENLTVILKNKDGKRKRDKKRKTEKRKTDQIEKKDKRRRNDKQDAPTLPSKEVFASGNNILVSVSFNKDKPQQQQQTTIVTLPPTKEQILSKKQNEREQSRRVRRTNRDAPRKHRKVDIKPVAIIDLDNSPFKEVTPSPRAVIILSDSDHENDKSNKSQSLNYSMVSNATDSIANDECDDVESNIRVSSPPQSPTAESATFELPLGPKTPPEPSHLVKFSISASSKTKIVRTVVNPLHDANDDDDDDENENMETNDANIENVNAASDKTPNQQKVGPNTPPGPCSPDVYDPFEPTKSASQSPNDSMNATEDEPANSVEDINKSAKPVDLAMALINSKASIDAANSLLSSTLGGNGNGGSGEANENDIPNDETNVSPFKEKPNDENNLRETATTKTSSIHVFSNILLTSAKDGHGNSRIQSQPTQSRSSTLTTSISVATTSKQSPLKFGTGSIISKLPLPKIPKPTRHNGNDDNMDIESPYSPGSSDYEDLFEPPQNSPLPPSASTSHLKKHSSRSNTKSGAAGTSSSAKPADIFDDLFGASPNNKHSNKLAQPKRRPSKHSSSIKDWIAVTKHSTQVSGYAKLNEEQLRMMSEEVPGSAVELQAKDKFLKKLNRQERVIEEVKLVLKPHYNKKHITKDEYKEIMRRAVPKICHNRTGEINPKKIKKLIEAYVGKFRQKRKQSTNLVIK